MQTKLDCLPCFLRQTLYTIRLCCDELHVQKRIMDRVLSLFSEMNLSLSPPENAVPIYRMIAELSDCADPFSNLKRNSNKLAMKLRPTLKQKIRASADPILTAVSLAVAGNIIDYGAHHCFDVNRAIEDSLKKEFFINDYASFKYALEKSKNILYLGDNSGELVFDGMLIEELVNIGKNVTLAVKEKPIINDAVMADALTCGLDQYCEVITNGTDCPGTPIAQCNEYFKYKFQQADLIISKGQGNYETLSEVRVPVFFLLTVKCPVVGEHIYGQADNLKEELCLSNGEMILMKSG